MKYYLGIKTNRLLIHATTHMDLRNIVSEGSHIQEYLPHDFMYRKFYKNESQSYSNRKQVSGFECQR